MKRHYDDFEDCLADARRAPEKDLISYSQFKDGGQRSIAAKMILQEIADEKQRKLVEMKLRRVEPHTVIEFLKKGTWVERIGFILSYGVLFLIGFLAAKNEFFSRLIQIFVDVKP